MIRTAIDAARVSPIAAFLVGLWLGAILAFFIAGFLVAKRDEAIAQDAKKKAITLGGPAYRIAVKAAAAGTAAAEAAGQAGPAEETAKRQAQCEQ
jgi:hypothetical protein